MAKSKIDEQLITDVSSNICIQFKSNIVKKLFVYGCIFESDKIYSVSSLDRDMLLKYSLNGEKPFIECNNNENKPVENVELVI